MTSSPDIAVRLEQGAKAAHFVVPADFPKTQLTTTLLAAQATGAGVQLTPAVETRLAEIVAAYAPASTAQTIPFATAAAPVNGEDARLDFLQGFNPSVQAIRAAMVEDGQSQVNHYAALQRVTVKAGQAFGRIVPATPGADGSNVCGGVLKAKPGKNLLVKIDRSIKQQPDGQLIAQVDGILQLERGVLKVNQVLEIPAFVDFSTGSIDFVGSVTVKEGVRDRFTVKASGDIEIGGLVEAATILCGGNLVVRRGIAAKGKGHLMVQGNAEVGFLEHVRGQVTGNLIVRKEVLNTDIIVGGDFLAEGGAIIGGRVLITGSAKIAVIGTEAYTPTTCTWAKFPC